MPDLLHDLAQSVMETKTKFNITRTNIWDGAKRAFMRHNYSPYHALSVKFTDDIGKSEGAVDNGGPRREFLQLLTEYLATNSPLFTGETNNKHLTTITNSEYSTVLFLNWNRRW